MAGVVVKTVALTPMTVVVEVAEEELLKEEALVVITLVVMVGTQRYKVPLKVILWLVEEEKAQALTPWQETVQNMAEVEEVLVEAVVPLTTVGVPSMVLEVAQAQGKELRMEDKVDVGVIGQQEAVEQRGQAEEPMAVMVRHGHMDVVTVAVEEQQDNQELTVVTVGMAERQVVGEEVLEAKVTEVLMEEAMQEMEQEGKLESIHGRR